MLEDQTSRRKFLLKSVVGTGAIAAGLGKAAGSSDIRVDADDADAYDSLQQAVLDAESGATITVASDVFNRTIVVPASKEITIRGDTGDDSPGAGPDAPVIDGEDEAGAGIILQEGEQTPRVTIEGFRIQNWGRKPLSSESGKGIATLYRSNLTIRDVSVKNVAGDGVVAGNDGRGTSSNITVENCLFDSIAHAAISLGSCTDSEIKNNEITATNPVPDNNSNWWEKETPDNNPTYGIYLPASASNGYSNRIENVVVEANKIAGHYDYAGIRLLADNGGGQQAIVTDVTIRENEINLKPGDGTPTVDENHGIAMGSNKRTEDTPTAIRDVHVEENEVTGATHAYKVISKGPHFPDQPIKGGIKRITFTGNSATDSRVGCIPLNNRDGELADVEVTENRFENCKIGVVLWSRGRLFSGATVANNAIEHDSMTSEYETTYGIQFVAWGAELDDVQLGDAMVQGHSAGVAMVLLEGGSVADSSITEFEFANNDTGIEVSCLDKRSKAEISVTRSTFEGNGVGVQAVEKTDASDIQVHMCDFKDHDVFAAENQSGIGVLDATCNFWEHPTGPAIDSNPRGRGERVSRGVNYDPLLPQSYTKVPGNACHPAAGNPKEHTGSSGRDSSTQMEHPSNRAKNQGPTAPSQTK